jgi:thiamine-monophosphate kinase
MLDVSDGLLLDAGRIAAASGVVLDLDPAALVRFTDAVRSAAPALAGQALDLVLTGGEDHGLLACFPPDVALPSGFVRLGVVRAGEPAVLLGGAQTDRARPGWDSFTASAF